MSPLPWTLNADFNLPLSYHMISWLGNIAWATFHLLTGNSNWSPRKQAKEAVNSNGMSGDGACRSVPSNDNVDFLVSEKLYLCSPLFATARLPAYLFSLLYAF